jgi:hypothetical protein
VSSIKPSDDGRARIVRLFNTRAAPVKALLEWSSPSVRVTRSSPFEEEGRAVSTPLELRGYGIITLRVSEAASRADVRREVPLFADTDFTRGFRLSYADTSHGRKPERIFSFEGSGGPPVWRLCQWGTKHSLATAKPLRTTGGMVLENGAKRVVASSGLMLEVRGGMEYGGTARSYGDPWPHLLVEQDAREVLPLDTIQELRVALRLRLVRFHDHMKEAADPSLHAAQFQLFLIVKNRNRDAADFGNFFWFGVPFFDNRYPIPRPHKAKDVGKDDATGKFIYSIDGREVLANPLMGGTWVTIDKNVLPFIKAALACAVERGHLKSADPRDYAVVNMNLGWEMPGAYDAAMAVRDLKVYAVSRKGPRLCTARFSTGRRF